MSKLLFCHYQPNGLGIKLVRIESGVPSGGLGRNQNPDNRKPNPLEEQDPLKVFDEEALEISQSKEKDPKEATKQAAELVRRINNAFLDHLTQLENLIEEAASPEANSSARDVVTHTAELESRTHKLLTRLSELVQRTNNDLCPAVEASKIRMLIDRIYKIIQKLEESPSKPILDDLQLLLMELEYYCPNEQQDYHPYGNAQLQNEQLAQAVQDAKELVTTIKRRFPVIIVQTAIKTVNEAIAELAIFSPYDNSIESFRLKLLNLLQLYYRYFRPYVVLLGKQYPDNELLIAMQQAMDGINSLGEEIGYTEKDIHDSLMSRPNELKGKLNDLLNKLKNQLENELLREAETVINSDNTPFDSLTIRFFS